jgi:hypothetical protein
VGKGGMRGSGWRVVREGGDEDLCGSQGQV